MSATEIVRPYLTAALEELYTTVEGVDEIADITGNPVIVIFFEGEKGDGHIQTVRVLLRVRYRNAKRASQVNELIGISSEITSRLYDTVRFARGLVVDGKTIFPTWFDVVVDEVKIIPEQSMGIVEMIIQLKTTGGGISG